MELLLTQTPFSSSIQFASRQLQIRQGLRKCDEPRLTYPHQWLDIFFLISITDVLWQVQNI
jgi:hypothetical protein